MLTELRVRDFAIIDDLQVQFHPGFNVLTGETGAGKSIIIDAIELLLGNRASQEVVRAGAPSASVEGLFDLSDAVGETIQARLRDEGLENDQPFLILAREVRLGGRSIARINGSAISQALLAEIGGQLIDIHGQGQHLSLLRPRTHIYLLDRFAGLEGERNDLGRVVGRLRQVRNELDVLRRDARELARRLDLLGYQVEEIDRAGLTPGEDAALEVERRRLANAETLSTKAAAIHNRLGEGEDGAPCAVDLVGEAADALGKLARLDPSLAELHSQAEDVFARLSDLSRAVAGYGDSIAYDPERLAEVEERLDLIHRLQRKYGDAIADILAFGERARAELSNLAQSETRTAELETEEERLLHEIGAQAEMLSTARAQAGARLASAVEQELEALRMAGTRFSVDLQQRPDATGCFAFGQRLVFDGNGIDQVEFLVSANPGEPLRPLVKVASGGETARLMLALKNVLTRADATPTLIFDEIDQGIGGRVGAIVGQKLYNLTGVHQVLCVTHLPQIAVYGDHHLAVRKTVEGERIVTRVQVLGESSRALEVAQMLGAATDSGLQTAAEMLADVEAYKRQGG